MSERSMKQLSKVVWSEGMHLAPHHFQLQSRYFEDSIRFALASLFFKPYGLVACELDADALRNGTVALLHARGVLPDGLAFHFPDGDPLPEPRRLGELFSPVHDSHVIHLALPRFRPDASNCATPLNGGPSPRYSVEVRPVSDETTGKDERPVNLARRNFRLLLDQELDQDSVSLPIARVRRDGTGHYTYDPAFIPPCLQIGASDRLLQLLGRLVEVLDAKSDALAGERSSRALAGEYGHRGIAGFWLLHAIRSSAAPLRHHLQLHRSHPEQLYVEMARLAGALCTFSLDADPRSLPLYDHDRPEDAFTELDRHIRALLEVAIPVSCVATPLAAAPSQPYLHAGVVTDRRCFGNARWILGIRSSLGTAELLSLVPRVVKLCASRHLLELVRRAYPGLPLEHLPTPPAAISPRPGTQYFTIGTVGACWNEIVKTGEVGVYVPESIPNADLEVLAVLAAD
jgi:type VI secretion system protein ImpJ